MFWFKPIIGKKSDVMIKNMFCGNWRSIDRSITVWKIITQI
ncbi:MAG: hypothetical protein ACKESC_01250 [Candidatus Hodgkinia cicadicola]